MDVASTVIIVPVLARPHRVEPTLVSLWEATDSHYRVLFVANHDDHDELAAIKATGSEVLTVTGRGTYPEKINAAYRDTTEPFLFLAADDLDFHVGWLTAALAKLDAAHHVIGTNDLGNERVLAGEHSTHTLVTRAYCEDPGGTADQPGSVLHEGYRHWYCDDELVGVARQRGVYAHAHDSIVEHLHPYHGKSERDDTYARGEQRKGSDLSLHRRRRRMWT